MTNFTRNLTFSLINALPHTFTNITAPSRDTKFNIFIRYLLSSDFPRYTEMPKSADESAVVDDILERNRSRLSASPSVRPPRGSVYRG